MPWAPELFSAPTLQRFLDQRRREQVVTVPYFDGFLAGEPDALVASFSGEPLLYDPLYGRVKGERAFRAFAAHMHDWLLERHASVDEVQKVTLERCGFEEVVLHLDFDGGRVAVPLALVGEQRPDGGIDELRVYHSHVPLRGVRATRQPLLQPDPDVRAPDAVREHQRALAAGDADALVAAFEPGGSVRESTDVAPHSGADGLRTFYDRILSHGGAVVQEQCRVTGDERTWALEYNVVGWGSAPLLPQAGVAVYVIGDGGRLAAVRLYDDVEPAG
jgi:SnoaL-like domain